MVVFNPSTSRNMDPSEKIIVQLAKHKNHAICLTYSTEDKNHVKAMSLRESHLNYASMTRVTTRTKYLNHDSILIYVDNIDSIEIDQDQNNPESTITVIGPMHSLAELETVLMLPAMERKRREPPPPSAAEQPSNVSATVKKELFQLSSLPAFELKSWNESMSRVLAIMEVRRSSERASNVGSKEKSWWKKIA
ncbi:hypothetical protein BD289DRAFT_65662 [Coniella lustricola]|uniref:Uncharacterized protein n=1 Tax=Coniella lustricola TaxID=2025994 RepID=A0A2T3AHV1_9PEZI|nr:hypothetical protein BD289DRAFT_65662 [Coniella lustricola]